MSLINREDLVEAICNRQCGNIVAEIMQIKECIADAPTIDAVPVVRCKDCKHSNTDHAISSKRTWCDYWGIDPDFDDFCCYGKRKDGGE